MKLVNLFLVVLLIIGCKKTGPSSAPKKEEGVTEQPTEVSGGFGLTMQCTVTNRDIPNAVSSEIACVVSNDDGTKFNGTYDNLKASITARNSSNKINVTPSQTTSDSPVSLIVSVQGVKPDDALSIRVEGKFDDAPAVLSASLLGPFALTCSRDINYWVKPGIPDPANLSCSEEQPCRSIGQALALIPDIINCNLTINVMPGEYKETLTIASREIRANKTIRIRGVDDEQTKDVIETPVIKAPDDLPIANPSAISASYPDKGLRTAIQINSILAKNAFIEFENIEIQGGADLETAIPATGNDPAKTMYDVSKETVGKFENGIYASTTSLKLTNVKLNGFSHVALLLDQSSRLVISSAETRPALEINKSRVGLRAQDVDRVFFGGETKITGNGDIQDGAGVDLARSINVRFLDDATLTIKDLAYGIIADKSLIQPASATARIEIENVFTGLHLVNYSEFIWVPKLSETKTSYLKIKKCYFVCIDADSSVLKLISEDVNPAETNKKRLELELDSRLTGDDRYTDREHYGLLRANNGSSIDFSYLENSWCNIGNYSNKNFNSTGVYDPEFFALTIHGNSSLNLRRYSFNFPVLANCRDSNKKSGLYIRNFDKLVTAWSACPYGSVEADSGASSSAVKLCYSDMGVTNLHVKNPPIDPNTGYPIYGPLQLIPPISSALDFKDPDYDSAQILDDMLTSSTAGGDSLEMITTGFHNVTGAKINEISVPVLSFDRNFSDKRQKVAILTPPHSDTSGLRPDKQIRLELIGSSITDPTKQVAVIHQITFEKRCPTKNYFQVAADSDLGTQPFCIMRFEAKEQSSRIVSEPDGLPLVNVTREEANAKCQSISPYYRLMSNTEWQAMARKTEYLLLNWDDTDTYMRRGHSDNEPSQPLAASNNNWPCFETDTGTTEGTACDTQWRYLRINPVSRVWDIAGNVAEWVSDNYAVTGTPDTDSYIAQITDPNLKLNFGPYGHHSPSSSTDYNGFGYLKINAPAGTYGIARGGSYMDGDKSGVFAADATLDPTQGYPHVGFRCVVTPPSTVN